MPSIIKITAKSFTLVETLLIVGIFSTLAVILIPFSIQQLNQNRCENSARQFLGKLFSQQQNAASQLNNLSYGVEVKTNSFVVFEGENSDNYSYSQEITFENGVTVSATNLTGGGSKIFFSKGEIMPTSYGKITIGDSASTYIVSINSEGMMHYYRQ